MVKIDMGTAVISLLWMVCVHGVAVTAVPTCSAEILDAVRSYVMGARVWGESNLRHQCTCTKCTNDDGCCMCFGLVMIHG
jgi:hypothetical protein